MKKKILFIIVLILLSTINTSYSKTIGDKREVLFNSGDYVIDDRIFLQTLDDEIATKFTLPEDEVLTEVMYFMVNGGQPPPQSFIFELYVWNGDFDSTRYKSKPVFYKEVEHAPDWKWYSIKLDKEYPANTYLAVVYSDRASWASLLPYPEITKESEEYKVEYFRGGNTDGGLRLEYNAAIGMGLKTVVRGIPDTTASPVVEVTPTQEPTSTTEVKATASVKPNKTLNGSTDNNVDSSNIKVIISVILILVGIVSFILAFVFRKKNTISMILIFLCMTFILQPAQYFSAKATAYTQSSKTYVIDNDKTIKEYNELNEWDIRFLENAKQKNGKLYCYTDKSFVIAGGHILGDDYGLEAGVVEFDMIMTEGEVSLGTRLISSSHSQFQSGIWMNITKDKIGFSLGGKSLEESIEHSLDLSKETLFKIINEPSKLIFTAAEQVLVTIDYGSAIVIKDGTGNVVKEVDNKDYKIPKAGYFKLNVNKLEGSLDNISYNHIEIVQNVNGDSNRKVDYSSWVATDDLGREVNDVTLTRKDKYVGVFYFIWLRSGNEIVDHTRTYLELGIDGLKSYLSIKKHSPGYWSEPYFGYYLSSDEWVYRKHASMLSDAGVDFIYLDFTNGEIFPHYLTTLLDTWVDIRENGGTTPQIVCHTGEYPHVMISDLKGLMSFYENPKYDELWFKWEGKPLIFGNNPLLDDWSVDPGSLGSYTKTDLENWLANIEGATEYYKSGQFQQDVSHFTLRRSWAIVDGADYRDGYWNWLDNSFPQNPGRDFGGKKEQAIVSLGVLANLSQGRSYLGEKYGNGKEDFEFTLGTAKYGMFFEKQFKEALKQDPRVIMITGWNEWIAGVIDNENKDGLTGNTKTPYYRYVDQFNPEFSRDAEPMKIRDGEGSVGYGDNYYYQMVSYIRKFKGLSKNVIAYGQNTIDIDSGQSAWDNVGPTFTDSINDIPYRSHESWASTYRYVNNSGRNDLKDAKVSQNDTYLYFNITTSNDLVYADDSSWMNLFINIDFDNNTGWEGYDFILNRSRTDNTVSVERFVNNSWEFEHVGNAEYSISRNSLSIKVNKSLLSNSIDSLSFDFKWADNSTTTGDVMQFMDLGDTAPNNRFAFRYLSSEIERNGSGDLLINILLAFSTVFAVIGILFLVLTVIKGKKQSN